MKVLTVITGTGNTANWTRSAQQTTILDITNRNFPRNVILSSDGVKICRPTGQCGFPLHDLFVAAAGQEANLTWAPIITTDPASHNAANNSNTNFTVVATSETGINMAYYWRDRENSNASWANIAEAGVYSGVNTAILAISNVSGLNQYQYNVVVTNCLGLNETTSNIAILTVT